MKLIDAIAQTESGGSTPHFPLVGDDNAIGDRTLVNKAYGCLQIRQGVVDQVNAKLGTTYKAQDCLGNRDLSVLIWNTYWTIFTKLVTDEDKAKAWNGGPGWKSIYNTSGYTTYSHNLDLYWATVQKWLAYPYPTPPQLAPVPQPTADTPEVTQEKITLLQKLLGLYKQLLTLITNK